jgi:cyclophilin family peptidyl-prolyl cis-trans isomerase
MGLVFLHKSGITGFTITGKTIEEKNPRVLLETTEGNILIELYPEQSPVTVANFLGYVERKDYDNTVFHRVIKGFMIQGGGFTEQGDKVNTLEPIKLESDNGLKNKIGTVAMARTMIPDSATNQFFINTVNNDFLDYTSENPGYAVFGEVIEGMDVVAKIENSETTIKNGMPDWPVEEIKIVSAKVIS